MHDTAPFFFFVPIHPIFRRVRSYRALVLQAHHEGAHVSRGLVVDDDHGLLLGDGPHVVAPLRHCRANRQERTGG